MDAGFPLIIQATVSFRPLGPVLCLTPAFEFSKFYVLDIFCRYITLYHVCSHVETDSAIF